MTARHQVISKLTGELTDQQKDRLRLEIKELDKQSGAYEYLLELCETEAHFSKNEHNLLIAQLLGLVEDVDLDTSPSYTYGEFPDIDVDYLKEVRDYLKNDWAPKKFGANRVCNIGNYTTFGIRNSLIDMARVHGLERGEILGLTTQLETKDDDGKALTFDGALKTNAKLNEYCNEHPEVADSARRLLDRNRGKGKHAGGLIVSSVPLDNFVPLMIDGDGNPQSAWVEGLANQDLQPVGLVKFDLLVITNLDQLAKCVHLIKQRHNLDSICALPGQSDWTDISYLNDEKALELANTGRLKCVFQFDSPGMQEMVKSGGVTSFDDLVAYTSLWRPGPLGMGMHERYIERKRGRELYDVHPIIAPILGNTYGVMVYQEQVMKILHAVGNIPLKDCEIVRKAISKKKEKIFAVYRTMFLDNGQVNLGWTEEQVQELWDQIVSFAEYGFNLSHAVSYTYVSSRLLWLKAHYPLEFFAAVLSCEKNDEKVKEYKLEAEKSGIKVNPVDLNKSGIRFEIIQNGGEPSNNDEIFIGFSNVKGIGEEPAQRIVDKQPYRSIEDFLTKFGTDANVLKPLVGLKVFGDAERSLLYEFTEYYKDHMKKRVARDQRYEKGQDGKAQELRFVLAEADYGASEKDAELRQEMEKWLDKEEWTVLADKGGFSAADTWKILKKYKRSKEGNEKKRDADTTITFESYLKVREEILQIPEGEQKVKLPEVPPVLESIYNEDIQVAEIQYYGFGWDHLLNKCEEATGRTFELFDEKTETQNVIRTAVEIQVIEPPKKRKSKKGTEYWVVVVEDADWRQEKVTVWDEDFARFEDEFLEWEDSRRGNLLRLRLQRPEPPFPNYTFESPPKALRHKLLPEKKEEDGRLMVLKKPGKELATDDELLLQAAKEIDE